MVSKDIVRVAWKDHCTANSTWTHVEDMVVTPVMACSVGIVMYEDDDMLILAQSVISEKRCADTMNIIKSCIVERIKLGEICFGDKT